MPLRRSLLLLTTLLGLLISGASLTAETTPPAAVAGSTPRQLKPEGTLRLELRGLIRLLEEVHFNRDQVTPASYAEVVPNLFKALDGQRLFLLASDLTEFQSRHRAESLYWNLATLGRLEPAFEIYSRYEKRVRERIQWIDTRLKGNFDFAASDTYELDRRELPWPADADAADALWEARLKFELLQELLNDKPLDEARSKVAKRYERLLRNLDDFEADDVAEVFLGAIASLYDPHSTYFSPDTYDDFSINMRLQLFGIGALLGVEDDVCVLKEIIPGGPADLSRSLKPNDKILAVAQDQGEFVEVVGMKLRRIVQMIRGEKGTRVRLLVQPADAADAAVRREIVLVRDLINLDSARAHGAVFQVPDAQGELQPLGVITLPTFYGRDSRDAKDQNSATDDIRVLIKRLQEQGVKGLVLDLRRNGGGLLTEAVSLTGLFIPTGPVVQIKNYAGEVKIDEDQDPAVAYDGPLVVLTSRFSASASEIVAGALQNYGRAVVVGDTSTHGKGSVQTVIEMGNVIPQLARPGTKAGATKVTVQKFYLPNGYSTQLKGVIPDIVIPSIDEFLPIGEQDLPHALPWDEISTSFYDAKPVSPATLASLRARSAERLASLPEFELLKKNISRFQERQAEKTVSLNLETRRAGKLDDKAFRESTLKARKALEESSAYSFTEYFVAPPPPPRIKADEPAEDSPDSADLGLEDDPEEDARYARMDVYLRESLRVLQDLRTLRVAPEVAAAR
ncbi:MAG: carboxy terminal-processing peptidase [Opitutaceae bacterium]|jgi:carboxyl-terminal processing protease|nr:carboxy terminal-processing peptidase [Opitutaceae bacterium]